MKKEVICLLFIFSLILIFNFVYAFEVSQIGDPSHSIDKEYAPSDYIKGWINISLINEPSNSLFEDSEGNSITLINLLELNSISPSCIPTDCESDYAVIEGSEKTEKIFDLEGGKSAIFGFKISGDYIFVNAFDFSLNVKSDVIQFDLPQLYIDILNDGSIEWQSYKPANDFRAKNYGCYGEPYQSTALITREVPYCEKITLQSMPNATIGAEVIQNSPGAVTFEMSIEEVDKDYYGDCEAIATGNGDISCSPSPLAKTTEEKDFFVCIKTKNSADNGNYSINYETDSANGLCGFSGDYVESYNIDFKIFARPDKYASIGNFTLDNIELENFENDMNIENDIIQYIYSGYNNNCSLNCIIPIKFTCEETQKINISNFKLTVRTNMVQQINNIYDVTETPATINADFQKLYLDKGNFSVPSDFEEHTFSLNLDDMEIFSEEIVVIEMPVIKSLTPRETAAAVFTEFRVIVDSPTNITKYEWDFGNNDTKTTTTDKVNYTYTSTGSYEVEITITDSAQLSSSKTFNVLVKKPDQAVNTTLKKKSADLINVKTQIENFPVFYQDSLKSILNLSESENKIDDINQLLLQGGLSDENYISIMTNLLSLEIPESIIATVSAESISFYPDRNSINLDILQAIEEGEYDASDESEYINAILAWNQENIETKITFKELSAKYKYFEEPILRVFKLEMNEKNSLEYDYYLILHQLGGLKFKEDYLEKEESGYIYINLTIPDKTIEFLTTENINFNNLPAFISPPINRLSITSPIIDEEKTPRWILLVLIFFLLFILAFIAYIILQIWYKKKYESYLFKKKNDLYNLISYINSAKKRGLKNKEIIVKLKKAGWTSEQIRYVTRKYVGEKTGMLEIPIEKILKASKKKNIRRSRKRKNPSRANLEQGKTYGQTSFRKYQ